MYFKHLNSSVISDETRGRNTRNRVAKPFDENTYFNGIESDDEAKTPEVMNSKPSPWTKSFKELRQMMIKSPTHNIYKRTVSEGVGQVMGRRRCQVEWEYSMFLESKSEALDTSCVRSGKTTTDRYDELMPGIWLALETMCESEESQFVIGYKLMYGEVGAPPRIPAKSDILLVVILRSFQDIADDDDDPEGRKKFRSVYKKAIESQKEAKLNFGSRRFICSTQMTHSTIKNLELCRLANKTEEDSQRQLLIELYMHLLECYSKMEDWKKICSMVEELKRLCFINRNAQILFHHGMALVKFGKFEQGLQKLLSAEKIDPWNVNLALAIKNVLETRNKYQRETKTMWKRAFQTKEPNKAFGKEDGTGRFKKNDRENAGKTQWKNVPTASNMPQENWSADGVLADNFKSKLTIGPRQFNHIVKKIIYPYF